MMIAALCLLFCAAALGEERLIRLVSVPQTPIGQYGCGTDTSRIKRSSPKAAAQKSRHRAAIIIAHRIRRVI